MPELGWALTRLHERDWVPFFRHWSQGSEFYTYSAPDNARPPQFLDSHFPSAGFAILRSSWKSDARSLYFRYGFQGSSHGGGLDKLNIELYCNDEPLLMSDSRIERSHFKNVVLVDYQNQEQCSGTLLQGNLAPVAVHPPQPNVGRASGPSPLLSPDPLPGGRARCPSYDGEQVRESERVQYLSALGGLGKIPDSPAIHDPRIEFGYWSTKHEECFPGVARMRRTIAFVDRRYFLVRDTLRSLDGQPHAYQWLFQTFAAVRDLGSALGPQSHTYYPRKIFLPDQPLPEMRIIDRHALKEPGRVHLESPRACLDMRMLAIGGDLPKCVDLWQNTALPQPITTIQIEMTGREVVLTTVLDARPQGEAPYVQGVRSIVNEGLDRQVLEIARAGGRDLLAMNETDKPWECQGQVHAPGCSCAGTGS